ncbi:hypothetical protein LX59_01198 [Azomonas agilis]|uniref:Uncharacterized protein n=1 Tax=Azomonas agilis TaxID=116849 RepID=A0A562J0F6_9GAMM|nr:YheV family putative zinc ribbon protein [Azomonas agilis]TWH76275.1 hypothetical protein LX59_01198 [Azomonas agilis]
MSEISVVIIKRFIAGAVCPSCNAQDSIKMWTQDSTPHRECVSCGYTDTFNEQGNPVPTEPDTRLSPPPKPIDPNVQTLRFVELRPKT